jgi:hypothetical protein
VPALTTAVMRAPGNVSRNARKTGVIMSTSPMLRSLKTAMRRTFCSSIIEEKQPS